MQSRIIYGSCVTRDAFEFADSSTTRRADYIARQSMISIDRPAHSTAMRSLVLESPFQNRLFHGDLDGNALDRIVAAAAGAPEDSLLLIDLVDERGGIYLHEDGGVITRTIDGADHDAYALLDDHWTLHGFGSMKHWSMYADAASSMHDALVSAGLWERTRVLAVKWASRDESGAPVPGSLGFEPDVANEVLDGYYEVLAMQGWTLVEAGAEPIAWTGHKWGLAPFHYTADYYRAIEDALIASL